MIKPTYRVRLGIYHFVHSFNFLIILNSSFDSLHSTIIASILSSNCFDVIVSGGLQFTFFRDKNSYIPLREFSCLNSITLTPIFSDSSFIIFVSLSTRNKSTFLASASSPISGFPIPSSFNSTVNGSLSLLKIIASISLFSTSPFFLHFIKYQDIIIFWNFQ